MKQSIIALTTLITATLALSSVAHAHKQVYQQHNFQQNLTAKPSQILLAESTNFVALAQKVDREMGLAAEEWNQFYKAIPQGRLGKKELITKLNYLIEASQRISQHHKNASQIAERMYPLSPSTYEEQTFVKTLVNFNATFKPTGLCSTSVFQTTLGKDLPENEMSSRLINHLNDTWWSVWVSQPFELEHGWAFNSLDLPDYSINGNTINFDLETASFDIDAGCAAGDKRIKAAQDAVE